jgi:hypothetical protein
MSVDFTHLAMTGFTTIALVGAAAWASLTKPRPSLNEARARGLLEELFPGRTLDAIWVAADGKGAMAKSGASALVLCAVGEEFVGRRLPWASALSGAFRTGRISIDLTDLSEPPAVLALHALPLLSGKRAA